MATLAIDIGGTNVRVAVFDEVNGHIRRLGDVRRRSVWNDGVNISPVDLADFAADVATDSAAAGAPVDAAGCAIAGMLDDERAHVDKALNVGWEDAPLWAVLQRRLGVPVLLDTDAFAGAAYELAEGAGRVAPSGTFLYVAVGTGIGHAFVSGRRIWRGLHNRANVFGHLTYEPEGRQCYCGARGCVCQYAAGPGIVMSSREFGPVKGDTEGDLAERESPMGTDEIFEAARAGDEIARQAVATATNSLGVALAHAYNLLDHELTILAGGVVGEFWPDVELLEQQIRSHIHPSIRHVRLEKSLDPGTGILRGMAIQTLLWWKEIS